MNKAGRWFCGGILAQQSCACLISCISNALFSCSTDGKTKCKRTIDGYECVCGDGYVPSDNGRTCLKINQCSASEADLHPDCTCERCACHDISGSANYEYATASALCLVHRAGQMLCMADAVHDRCRAWQMLCMTDAVQGRCCAWQMLCLVCVVHCAWQMLYMFYQLHLCALYFAHAKCCLCILKCC